MTEKKKPEEGRQLFRPSTPYLAINPEAINLYWGMGGYSPTTVTEEGIAIVPICGPLDHHSGGFFDSYDSILCRVECAMAGSEKRDPGANPDGGGKNEAGGDCEVMPARAVILCIDSPGGEAAGSTFCHRKLRSLRKQYGVPLYAYANETAASAAYAIASACDEIWLPDTGTVGSIGVIATLFDRTKANEKDGLVVELVTSGAYKADGHADRPLDDGIRERMQDRVDSLAEIFWAVVAKARGMSPQEVEDLEAGVFIGDDAIVAGVADGVMRWDQFLRLVVSSLEGNEPAS